MKVFTDACLLFCCCCCDIVLPLIDILINLKSLNGTTNRSQVQTHGNLGENSHFGYHNTHCLSLYPYDDMTINRLWIWCTYSECKSCELLGGTPCGIKKVVF